MLIFSAHENCIIKDHVDFNSFPAIEGNFWISVFYCYSVGGRYYSSFERVLDLLIKTQVKKSNTG